MEPTGNARAYTFSDEPLVRMRNTAIRPGTGKLEDMIGSIDHGYCLKRTVRRTPPASSCSLLCGKFRSCEPQLRLASSFRPFPAGLRKVVARLHPHPVVRSAPTDVLQRKRHVRRQPRFTFSRRDSVPRSECRRSAVPVTFQPISSMICRSVRQEETDSGWFGRNGKITVNTTR